VNHKFRTITIIVFLTLLLGVSGTMAQDTQPAGEISIASELKSQMNYQGVLKEDGQPVTGSRDMIFRLYSDDSCTNLASTEIVMADVPVTRGLFSVALEVLQSDFDGQGLWLEVEVEGTAIACQEIMAVPYALSLRPEAIVRGNNTTLTLVSNEKYALWAQTSATDNYYSAVRAKALGTTGLTYGIHGTNLSTEGRGVVGVAEATTGLNYGVMGISDSDEGRGVAGIAESLTGTNYGVTGRSYSTSGRGGYFYASAATGETYGVYGQSNSPDGYGVYGAATASSQGAYGVYGRSDATSGTGVFGYATANGYQNYGVSGRTDSKEGYGVYGQANVGGDTAYAVYGAALPPENYAGYFFGKVHVQGTLSKSLGAFKIDHPLDPENQYLSHSFVESPDMMNVYNGNVVLDGNGQAWVDLPDYFEALNREFRYQLTCLGGFAPVYIAREIENNRFQIAGGLPGLKVSWQVTGVRQDPYAIAHPIIVEEEKAPDDQGYYLNPEVYGKPASMGIHTRYVFE
jgi:hypothetical protein